MALDTFEERQAYFEQCSRENHAAQVEQLRFSQRMAEFEAAMQMVGLRYEIYVWTELAPLIYRGMFDPTFCARVKP